MIVWLLKTLEKNPASIFRKKNLLRKSKEQFEKLKTQGFLIYSQPDPDHETYPCTHPCTKACPMEVVNMQGKLFAICPEDTEVDPIPLTKDDISKYCFTIDILIKRIREDNDFAGDNYPFNHRLHFIGEHVIGGINTAFILALYPNVQDAEPHLLSLPSRIPTNYEQIVVVTPSLSLTQEPIYAKLKNASMVPVTLTPSFGQQNFKINYLDAVRHFRKNLQTINKKTTPPDKTRMSPEAKVLAVFADKPDLNMTAIAKEAGVNRTSLYRMEKFMAVRKMRSAEENESYRSAKPTGEKNGKTGDMEAWQE